MATQVRNDERIFQQNRNSKYKMYKSVLKELSLTSWNDCNYSIAVKQQAMYAAFEVIPQFKCQKVFQELANLFEEQLDIQSEIFTLEEEFQAKLLCKTKLLPPTSVVQPPKTKRSRNDGDHDEDCSMMSIDSTLNSKRGAKAKKSVSIKKEPDEPLENYRKLNLDD